MYDDPKKFLISKEESEAIANNPQVSKGGKKGKTGGFYANRELARIAGAKGGRISRRTKSEA